jgi:predicted transposase YbfD/YdcC
MNLFKKFEVLEDPRDERGKKYKLIDIVIMTIYGILNKHEDFNNIAYFLELNEKYFVELLKIAHGKTPSHDCLSDIYAAISPKKFMEVFVEWTKDIVKIKSGSIINIDGKAVREAQDKINGGNIPYIVSAFLGDVGISIGQVKVEEKSSEYTAIPELLEIIDIKGCTKTIDAAGTYPDIAKKILSKKADFVLKAKDNQPNLLSDCKFLFNNETEKILHDETIEKGHGRIERRKYYLYNNSKNTIVDPKWDNLVNSIGKIEVTREYIGYDKKTVTEHYYVMSRNMTIEEFKKATRSHWGIECSLHWVLDVIFNEDSSRNREGDSIHNLSLIRKIVFNLVKLDDSFGKVPFNRKLTNYQHDFSNIENLIFEIIPNRA